MTAFTSGSPFLVGHGRRDETHALPSATTVPRDGGLDGVPCYSGGPA